ncbi:MAG: hypothetical protein R3F61_30130 [Myxococcota bacterium]
MRDLLGSLSDEARARLLLRTAERWAEHHLSFCRKIGSDPAILENALIASREHFESGVGFGFTWDQMLDAAPSDAHGSDPAVYGARVAPHALAVLARSGGRPAASEVLTCLWGTIDSRVSETGGGTPFVTSSPDEVGAFFRDAKRQRKESRLVARENPLVQSELEAQREDLTAASVLSGREAQASLEKAFGSWA